MMKLHYFFSMRKTIWLYSGLLLFILGCPSGDAIEDDGTAALQDLQFNYHQGLNFLYFGVRVESSYLGKNIQAVNALYFGFDTTNNADTLVLNDAGINGDIISADGVYAIKVKMIQSTCVMFWSPLIQAQCISSFLHNMGP
jgi:hypothetical protein